MPTPDDPDEFFLLLSLVAGLFPLQLYLGRQLHKHAKSTSFFHCLFAISSAKFASIEEQESEAFRETLKAYQRKYYFAIFPLVAVVFGVYFWIKWKQGTL